MSDFKLTQISNVMLGTTDLARSLAFYRDTLGLTVQFEMPGFVFLDAGGTMLALSEAHAKLATPVAGGPDIRFGRAAVFAGYGARAAARDRPEPRAVGGQRGARPRSSTPHFSDTRNLGSRAPEHDRPEQRAFSV